MSHESWWVMSQDESLVMTHPNSSQWRRRNQPSEARNRKNNMTFLFFVYLFVVHLCTCLFVCCALVYLFRLWWNFNGEDETNRAKRGIGKKGKGKRKKGKEKKGKKKEREKGKKHWMSHQARSDQNWEDRAKRGQLKEGSKIEVGGEPRWGESSRGPLEITW